MDIKPKIEKMSRDLKEDISGHLKRVGWDKETLHTYLKKTHGKETLESLTVLELMSLSGFLKKLSVDSSNLSHLSRNIRISVTRHPPDPIPF